MDEFLGVAVEDYAALIQDEELGAVVDSAVRDWFYLARLLVEAVCGQKKGVLQAMGDQQGCPACGEPDPLTFSALQACRLCRSCGSDLAGGAAGPTEPPNKGNIQAVQDAYRAALLGIAPDPTLLRKATHRSFRLFVEEMLEILTRNLNPCSEPHDLSPVVFPRQDIVQIITQLILNAAPSSDQFVRRKRYARGLVLWATLLKMMSEYEAKAIEQASMRWPLPPPAFCTGSALPRTKALALNTVSSHNEFLRTI